MKKLTVLLFLILFVSEAYAQGGKQRYQIQQLRNAARDPRVLSQKNVQNIDGTPFYNEDWRTGYVIVDNNTQSNILKLQYSSYTNELLFRESGKTMALTPNQLQGFVFTDQKNETKFKNGFYSSKYDIGTDQLMRVIYDGDTKLLAKEYTYLHKSKDPFSGKMEYKFLPKRDYYLVTTNGTFHKINLKDDDIYEALEGSHKQELKQYAEQQNLDYGDEHDVQQLLKKYDAISN